jgi:hypothetical protein
LLDTQVSIELLPFATVVGPAVSVTVGAGAGGVGAGGVGVGAGGGAGVGAGVVTATVAVCVVEPPDPVQVSAKLVVELSGGVEIVPLVGSVPLQPPEAEQSCALLTVQSNLAV